MTDLNPPGAGDRRRDANEDPRREAAGLSSAASLRPIVAGKGAGGAPWLVGGGAVLLGAFVFLWLSSHRAEAPHGLGAASPLGESVAPIAPPPPAPPEVAAMEAAGRGIQAPAQPPAAPLVAPPAPLALPVPPPAAPAAPTGRGAVLVVDLGEPAAGAAVEGEAGVGKGSAKGDHAAGDKGAAASAGLNGNEQFAERVSGGEPPRAQATRLRNRSSVIAQGAMIPAVLETALDSDLPGFARAVVSRDVRSFDGSQVLIQRGSRLIGEYRSATVLGQTRAFVIWTRVLRPDGVSIQIGSPVTDPLGRSGVSGSVNRHFLESFGGAILLSVVSAGSTALAGSSPATEIVIGSSQQANALASTVSAYAPVVIPPTIKVPQGTPIRVFVARDLDFSPVQGSDE